METHMLTNAKKKNKLTKSRKASMQDDLVQPYQIPIWLTICESQTQRKGRKIPVTQKV